MGWGTFKAKNFFNGLFSQDGITKTIGNMRELLLLSPFNVKFSSLIVVVVMSVLSF